MSGVQRSQQTQTNDSHFFTGTVYFSCGAVAFIVAMIWAALNEKSPWPIVLLPVICVFCYLGFREYRIAEFGLQKKARPQPGYIFIAASIGATVLWLGTALKYVAIGYDGLTSLFTCLAFVAVWATFSHYREQQASSAEEHARMIDELRRQTELSALSAYAQALGYLVTSFDHQLQTTVPLDPEARKALVSERAAALHELQFALEKVRISGGPISK